MNESQLEDNQSVHSYGSNISSNPTLKDKLETLINMELKHSGVYYDLHSKNNLLKVDLENLYNSCQRFESQEKKKSELLEECYEKLLNYQRRAKTQLEENLLSTMRKLEELNCLFYNAFYNYNSEVLKNSINTLKSETEALEEHLIEIKKQLQVNLLKGNVAKSLMTSKYNQKLNIELAINMLFEFSMKRPEIEIEDVTLKLSNEIEKLKHRREEIESTYKRSK